MKFLVRLVKRAEVESYESPKDIQVTGGEVSSEFPDFCGQRLLKASHITL